MWCNLTPRAAVYTYIRWRSLSHWLKYIKHIKRATIKNHFQWLNMRIYYCHAVDVCTHIEMYTCGYSLAGHNSRIILQIFGLIRTSGRRLAHIRAASLFGAVRRRHWRRLRPPTPSCLENFPPHFLCVNEWERQTLHCACGREPARCCLTGCGPIRAESIQMPMARVLGMITEAEIIHAVNKVWFQLSPGTYF